MNPELQTSGAVLSFTSSLKYCAVNEAFHLQGLQGSQTTKVYAIAYIPVYFPHSASIQSLLHFPHTPNFCTLGYNLHVFICKYGQLFHFLLLASQPLANTTSLGSSTTLGLNQPEIVVASQSPAACTEYSSASSGDTTTSARDHCHLCWGLQSHLLEIIIICVGNHIPVQ